MFFRILSRLNVVCAILLGLYAWLVWGWIDAWNLFQANEIYSGIIRFVVGSGFGVVTVLMILTWCCLIIDKKAVTLEIVDKEINNEY